MEPRIASVNRKTKETDIQLTLNLDGTGNAEVNTGVGFFDHMLNHIARHGLFDLSVQAQGDLIIDDHHTVEDVGIALGSTFRQALQNCAGIDRVGNCFMPMDEALVQCSIDISGRGHCVCELDLPAPLLGHFTTELTPEFFRAFAVNAGWTVHIRQISGTNTHHIVEAAFKAFARAAAQAVALNPRVTGIPSTKGVL